MNDERVPFWERRYRLWGHRPMPRWGWPLFWITDMILFAVISKHWPSS